MPTMSELPDAEKHRHARELWTRLGDVPVDDDGYIEIAFLQFPAGTDREDIWHWFESEFNLSVVEDLMKMKEDGMAKKNQSVYPKSPEYKPVLGHKQNFETLRKAFANEDVALLEVEVDVEALFTKGERVACLAAVVWDGQNYNFTPFALMPNGNPFELLKMVEPEGESDAVPEES